MTSHMERHVAEQLMQALIKVGGSTNEVIAASQQIQDAEERRAIRQLIGPLISQTHDVMMHVVRQYPDLDPDKKTEWLRKFKSKRSLE